MRASTCALAAALLLLTVCETAAASPLPAVAPCNVSLYPDINLDGVNLPNQPVSSTCTSASECAGYCCAAPGCRFFTLNAGSGPRDCYLKSNHSAPRANPGAISGALNGSAPAPPPPIPPPGAKGYLDAVADCGCDGSGAADATACLQACVDAAYGHTLPRVPVRLPAGASFTISDTLSLRQDNPGPDDGINVVGDRRLLERPIEWI